MSLKTWPICREFDYADAIHLLLSNKDLDIVAFDSVL